MKKSASRYSGAPGAMILRVKVIPGAKIESVRKTGDDSFTVKTVVAPERGKANDRVIALLAGELRVRKSRITLLRGATGRDKVFLLETA